MANEFGIDLDDAVNELSTVVESAHSFMTSEYEKDWETGEAYFDGKSDIPTEANRSTMVKTEVRDVIRSLMPSILRVLTHARKPVVYVPNSIMTAAFAEQQGEWICQTFWRNGGYKTLYTALQHAFKLKACPLKTYWLEDPEPEHIHVTAITAAEVIAYQELPDVVVDEVTELDETDPTSGETLFDLRATRYFERGRLVCEAFPIYEFFVERRADNLEDYVHGHRRSVTVSEAIEMGLEYENWRELGDDDPKENDAVSVEQHLRGYVPDQGEDAETDIMNFEFLLTEVYCKYDMDGDGVPEKYVFYLGGNQYQYLHHERIEEFCIDLVNPDPLAFAVIGRSIVDITKSSQDTETSLLRAVIDNALMANNPRPAADPTRTNFQDLMNNGIGAPIRTKGSPDIQYADIPFTAQSLLPFLQYLEQDTQMRVGVTKAAHGLDPDAMQSTDKDAVRNTIAMSQGQIELMARNVVELTLIPVFRKMLRLSMRHMDKLQVMRVKDEFIPVDISKFDPDLIAEPNVGIGTASPEEKLMTLQFIYGEQQKYIMSMGMDNPFTSLSQVYNTLEDIIELGGITNAGRYFNHIDKGKEAVIARRMAEAQAQQAQQAQANQPLDPGKALMMTESMKARNNMQKVLADMRMKELELQQKSLESAEKLDIERDRLVQDRVIKLAELQSEEKNEQIRREQNSNNTIGTPRQQTGQGAQSSGG